MTATSYTRSRSCTHQSHLSVTSTVVTLVSPDNYSTPKCLNARTMPENPPATASDHPLPRTVPLSQAVSQRQRLMYSRIKHLCRTFLGSYEPHKSTAWQLGHRAVVAQWHLYATNCHSMTAWSQGSGSSVTLVCNKLSQHDSLVTGQW